MSAVLPQLAGAELDKVTLGLRPLPKDGQPIIGFPRGRRDVYLTVMHSGITLGPLVGRLAATEILDGVEVDPLAPVSPRALQDLIRRMPDSLVSSPTDPKVRRIRHRREPTVPAASNQLRHWTFPPPRGRPGRGRPLAARYRPICPLQAAC